MIDLKSHSKKGIIYLFEGNNFEKETIEKGIAFQGPEGKLVSSLELDVSSDDYLDNEKFKAILKDCCPAFMVEQGSRACMTFVNSLGMPEVQEKLYVHTVQQ